MAARLVMYQVLRGNAPVVMLSITSVLQGETTAFILRLIVRILFVHFVLQST